MGLRIALSDIVALGLGTGVVVVVSMVVTIAAGFLAARMLGLPSPFGALAGVGTAVCGASATLATSAVVPEYPGKDADVVFVVVGVNALATLAMVIYPPLCVALGFDPQTEGVMLGATIHDVAQVAGAGYAVSDAVGGAAVIVKLFRVFLLLPVVLAIGWWFRAQRRGARAASVPGAGVRLRVSRALHRQQRATARRMRLRRSTTMSRTRWSLASTGRAPDRHRRARARHLDRARSARSAGATSRRSAPPRW